MHPNYRDRAIERYFSSHYQHFTPVTPEGWAWVIRRIELNFGTVFSHIPKDSLILDLACGVGYLEHFLVKNGFARIHAIDLSKEQIQAAERWLQREGIEYMGKVRFEVVDAFASLQKPDSYDVIAMIDLLEHFTKNEALSLLDRAHEALKSRGFLLIRTPNAEHPMFGRFYNDFTHETPFTIASLSNCLALSGFHIVSMGYERMPELPGIPGLRERLNRYIRTWGLRALVKLLDIPLDAFSPDIVAVGQK